MAYTRVVCYKINIAEGKNISYLEKSLTCKLFKDRNLGI